MGSKVILGDFVQKYLTLIQFNFDKFTIFTIPKLTLIFLYMHIVTVGLWGHLIWYFKNLNGEPITFAMIGTDAAAILSSYFAFYFEIVYIIYNKEIRAVLRELSNFEEYEMPENFAEEVNEMNRITRLAVLIFYMSQFIVWIATLFESCEDGVVDDCGLGITAYMPFDIFYTPMRQIFSFLQCNTALTTGTATMCIGILFMYMMKALVLQTQHLQKMLLEIRSMDNLCDRKKMIKTCVLYHCRILRLMGECKKHSEKILILLISIISVIMSLASYQLIRVKVEYATILHLFGYIISCIAICIHGEHLVVEGENLFFTLYDSVPWSDDVGTAKDLYIMMLMARAGMSLPAGKFGPIGHVRGMLWIIALNSDFVYVFQILKGVYSFLTLILNF